MAAGDTLAVFFPADSEPPSSNFATFDTRNAVLILDFDDATDESVDFAGFMPRHASSAPDLTVTIGWMFTSSGTPGTDTCEWDVSFASVTDDADDLDGSLFAAVRSVTATSASADGEVAYDTITFTNAQADGIASGEYFRMRITRDAGSGTADPGDAELVFIEIKET